MSDTSFKKDLEDLVTKAVEANKVFINESAGLIQQIASSKGKVNTINIFQNDFLSKALNAYVSLNIQHTKNMIDLGISLTKSMNQQNVPPETETANPLPAFILNASAKLGETISLQFVIDNNKADEVSCRFIASSYVLQTDFSISKTFRTDFSPQSFSLSSGGSQAVDIKIAIPGKTEEGLYISNVQVKGFEPAFFSIHILIS